MDSSRLACASLLVASLLCSCAPAPVRNQPGATFGQIHVGAPRVSGRERLINERALQDLWLRQQLELTDSLGFGFNAKSDQRSFDFTRFSAAVQADPAFATYSLKQGNIAQSLKSTANANKVADDFLVAARQDVLERYKRKEIDAATAKTELAALGVNTAPAALPETGPTAPAAPAAAAAPVATRLLSGTPPTDFNRPMDPTAKTASSMASPIDVFRDRMAYREEIFTERIKNALDETHDIGSNTLYRFTFDTTILPANDTSAWGIVTVSVLPRIVRNADGDPGKLTEAAKEELWADLVYTAENIINDDLDSRFRLMLDKHTADCKSIEDFDASVRCVAVILPDGRRQELLKTLALFTPQLKLEAKRPERMLYLFGLSVASDPPKPETKAQEFAATLFSLLDTDARRRFESGRLPCFFKLEATNTSPVAAKPAQFKTFNLKITQRPTQATSAITIEELTARHHRFGCKGQVSHGPRDQLADYVIRELRTSVYAVTPAETVQRLSTVSSSREASEMLLGLSAITQAAGLSAALEKIRANEAVYDAIRRQPLIVGLTESGRGDASAPIKATWVLGPQFATTPDGKSSFFRHGLKQFPLSAVVSLPAWAPEAEIVVCTGWKREDLLDPLQASEKVETKSFASGLATDCRPSIYIRLPARPEELLAAFNERGARAPDVDVPLQSIEVTVDKPAQVLITGRNLWRSPEVYIGAQRADEVAVLPDMRGIVARFAKIEAPNGSSKTNGTVAFQVLTSEGRTNAGWALVRAPDAQQKIAASGFGRRIISGQTHAFVLQGDLSQFAEAKVVIKSEHDSSLAEEIAPQIGISGRIAFTVPAAVGKLASGDSAEVFLALKRAPAAPIDLIPVAKGAVYYKTLDESKAAVVVPTPVKVLPVTIQLKLPRSWKAAYAGVADGVTRIRPVAHFSLSEKLPLDLAPCAIDAQGICLVTITSTDAALLARVIKEAVKITFTIAEDDSPPLTVEEFVMTRP